MPYWAWVTPPSLKKICRRLHPLTLPNVHAHVFAVPNAVFPATAADREICQEAYFDAGLKAAAAGADAIYINTVGDYGHDMLEDAVPFIQHWQVLNILLWSRSGRLQCALSMTPCSPK